MHRNLTARGRGAIRDGRCEPDRHVGTPAPEKGEGQLLKIAFTAETLRAGGTVPASFENGRDEAV